MKTEQIKSKGTLFNREQNCEMYLVIGGWNQLAKKPNYEWYMISEKTGTHSITTNSNRPDERVNNHWNGFLRNQNR